LPYALLKQQFIKRLLLIIITGSFALSSPVFSQSVENDTIGNSRTTFKQKKIGADSLNLELNNVIASTKDSTDSKIATASPDSIPKPKKKKLLDAPVEYTARDSMRFDVQAKKIYLYGEAQVDYETIKLTGGYIEIDLNIKTIFAKGVIDSLGKEIEKPVFEDKGQSFTTKEMSFNFDTKKGLIKDVITKEGEGYIHGESVKKMENDVMYIKSGKYTTCDNPEPHFHIHATRLKIIPNDKIITGPAVLKIENLPTPLALPFGFFPNKVGQTSGIIMPRYGESQQQGFFLNDGGYYFALSERMDLSLMGDIYSKGSWAIGGITNYRRRYKFNGTFDARYSNIKVGESGLRDFRDERGLNPFFQDNRDFMIRWNHNQDVKARPNSIFSANVNAGTSNYNRLNSFSGTNAANALTSQLQSRISYTRSWAGKPYKLSLDARHSQNTITGDVSVTLPEATFAVNRFFPFKRAVQIGEQRWYEKIGVTYTNRIKNELVTKDSLLWDPANLSRMRNGMIQDANASTSFRFLKHFTFSPGVSTSNWTYIKTLEKRWDNENDTLITDTLSQFSNAFEAKFSSTVSTQIYGMYQFKRGPVQAIRHVITPQVGFTYRPDFGFERPIYGYFGANGNIGSYSPYELGVFNYPAPGAQGLVTFNIIQNLEMKVKSAKDSISGFKKIKIFENISINTNHNIFAEQFKWQPVTINGRTQLLNKFDLVFGGIMDPYALGPDSARINTFEWDKNKSLGRFTSGRLALNFSLKSKDGKTSKTPANTRLDDMERIRRNPDAYVDFNIPWSLSAEYVLNYQKPFLTPQTTQSIRVYGDFNLTQKWKFGYDSSYDFTLKDISYTALNIYRDLHCWEMVFNWIPVGFNKGYTFEIRVKSDVLKDLKLTRRRSWFDMQ
jgi:hypothetical protein